MSRQPSTAKRTQVYPAQRLFFPAAAIHAAVILPLSVLAMVTSLSVLPGLASRTGHAHEMLFGFGLAVVAGFLINRAGKNALILLFGTWLAARAAFVFVPDSVISLLANIAFAILLSVNAAPQFLTAAKKWRNQIFAPTVIALSICITLFHVFSMVNSPAAQIQMLNLGVLLFALLMTFMGGRIIAPAVAGHLQTLGLKLDARVQPRIEAVVLFSLLAAIASAPIPCADRLTGILLLIAAGGGLVRLLRWRLWHCYGRSDLLCLGAGYAWLVMGLALFGLSMLLPALRSVTALHALTVGALGTLTVTVMARTRVIKAGWHPGKIPGLVPAAVLISLAALARLFSAYSTFWLIAAALLWSLAFVLLLRILVRVRTNPDRRHTR